MNLQFIKYFVTLAETKNFTQAAAKNFVVQSTFSTGIKKLETHFGSPLFHRDKRNVSLTNKGKALLPKARQLLAVWHQIETGFDNLESKELKVGLLNNILMEAILPRIHRFKQQYIDYTFSLSEGNETQLMERLTKNELDCIIIKDTPINKQVLESIFLYEEKLTLAIADHHPLANKRKIELKALQGLPFIERRHCTLFDEVFEELHRQQIQINQVFSSDNDELVRGLIALEVGCSLMSQPIQAQPGIAYIPLDGVSFTSRIMMIWKKNHHFPALDKFIKS
ncbi:LysR family transcriptional regulator [uncultured Microscilla sp.]|uniref:LysR family transcriptional regulator n=1 Tax=uncultured Microscilla sp. TaxID=432653 RepID=UPI0026159309|nr:LysR family transcriptional regulator [uncultured Microscilla sp.]